MKPFGYGVLRAVLVGAAICGVGLGLYGEGFHRGAWMPLSFGFAVVGASLILYLAAKRGRFPEPRRRS